MQECINGYALTEGWHMSGAAQWSYAEKDGKQWFIKRFLSPKYKIEGEGISRESVGRAAEYCEEFRRKQERYYERILKSDTGNIIYVTDFFSYETSFYAVSPRVTIEEMSIAEVAELPYEKKLVLMRVLAYCLEKLHGNGVVHADLKPSNIILKKTETGKITLKLIDFDAGFLTESPPKGEEVVLDPLYVAPETLLALDDTSVDLNEKIDVFALGLMFHQFFTGKYPELTGGCEFAAEAALCKEKILLENGIPSWLQQLIREMLHLDPQKRPATAEIVHCLLEGREPAKKPEEKKDEKKPEEKKGEKRAVWYTPKL